MQIEGTKLIFVMNFSVLDFFKIASRMPQITQISVNFQNFNFPGRGWEGGGGRGGRGDGGGRGGWGGGG